MQCYSSDGKINVTSTGLTKHIVLEMIEQLLVIAHIYNYFCVHTRLVFILAKSNDVPIFFVRSKRECYYDETFIASNSKVDSHIHKVYQGVKHSVSLFDFF